MAVCGGGGVGSSLTEVELVGRVFASSLAARPPAPSPSPRRAQYHVIVIVLSVYWQLTNTAYMKLIKTEEQQEGYLQGGPKRPHYFDH